MSIHSLHALVAPPIAAGGNRIVSAPDRRSGGVPTLRAIDGEVGEAEQACAVLVQSALDGETSALAQLVRRLLPAVKSAIRARIGAAAGSAGDPARATEDLAQEFFLELFAHDGRVLRRWRPQLGLPLERFAALIADRRAVSWLRARRGIDRAEDIDDLRDVLTQEDADPAAWLQSRQALALLFAALTERLSPLGQRLFRLLFVDEHEVDEVSRLVGMSNDAVYAWRSRLKRRVADVLSALAFETPGVRAR